MNTVDNYHNQVKYVLGRGYTLSVITGFGTYSRPGFVEMALLDENGHFAYSLMGGDVVGYFPDCHVKGFVKWFNDNCDSDKFLYCSNLPQEYLKIHDIF